MAQRSKKKQQNIIRRRQERAARKATYKERAAKLKQDADAKRKLAASKDHPNGACGNVGCKCVLGALPRGVRAMALRGYDKGVDRFLAKRSAVKSVVVRRAA